MASLALDKKKEKTEKNSNNSLSVKICEAFKKCDSTGGKELNLDNCNLTELPQEVIKKYKSTLEFLNVSNNHLTTLPDNFNELTELEILFFYNNDFIVFPKILGTMPIYMLSFKKCKLKEIPEEAINESINWLILTDNEIETLPKSIGTCKFLRKCLLAGNQLTSLPTEMKNCQSLELLRISANNLKEIPSFIFELPRLAWFAFASNPCLKEIVGNSSLKFIDSNDIELVEKLGEGASGVVWSANISSESSTSAAKERTDSANKMNKKRKCSSNSSVKKDSVKAAIKIFKDSMTSDGLPGDEMKIMSIVGREIDNLFKPELRYNPLPSVIGNAEVDGKSALIMHLIPKNEFTILGNPPDFDSCTRDTFSSNLRLDARDILSITYAVLNAINYMHENKISHGDVYAHNIMIENRSKDNNYIATCLCDFGASTFYRGGVDKKFEANLEKIEVRAFGNLIEDLLNSEKTENGLRPHCLADDDDGSDYYLEQYSSFLRQLEDIQYDCQEEDINARPGMKALLCRMKDIRVSNASWLRQYGYFCQRFY